MGRDGRGIGIGSARREQLSLRRSYAWERLIVSVRRSLLERLPEAGGGFDPWNTDVLV